VICSRFNLQRSKARIKSEVRSPGRLDRPEDPPQVEGDITQYQLIIHESQAGFGIYIFFTLTVCVGHSFSDINMFLNLKKVRWVWEWRSASNEHEMFGIGDMGPR
jgi:hypothetical protein